MTRTVTLNESSEKVLREELEVLLECKYEMSDGNCKDNHELVEIYNILKQLDWEPTGDLSLKAVDFINTFKEMNGMK